MAPQMFDHMAIDGLEDAYERGKGHGRVRRTVRGQVQFHPRGRDRFAIASTQRAKAASNEDGSFDWKWPRHAGRQGRGTRVVKFDEQPFRPARQDSGPEARLQKDGTITAANASSISDGAAALVLMRESTAKQMGATPVARIARTRCTRRRQSGSPPRRPAPSKVLKKAGWDANASTCGEVNEAFAAVTMAAMTEFSLPHEIVNVHGGACALGHRSAPRARASSSPCWAR